MDGIIQNFPPVSNELECCLYIYVVFMHIIDIVTRRQFK